MKFKIVLGLMTFIASSSINFSLVEALPLGSGYDSTEGVDCSHSEDGTKIPSPTKCTEFYMCDHGVPYLFKCPEMPSGGRLYFDPMLDKCNWPNKVDCEITSTNPSQTTTVSESPDNITALIGAEQAANVDCSNSEDGTKIPSPTKCTEFYVCDNKVAYLFKCPKMASGGRLYFDSKLDVCNWPQNVDCEITTTNIPTTTEATETPDKTTTSDDGPRMPDGVDCSQEENGKKLPSPTSCTEYYMCFMGIAYLYDCPKMASGGRLYFNPQYEICDWPYNVDCEITTTNAPSTTMTTEASSNTTTEEPTTTLAPVTSTQPQNSSTTTEVATTSDVPVTSTQPQNSSTTTPEAPTTSEVPVTTTQTQNSSTTTPEVPSTSEAPITSTQPQNSSTTTHEIPTTSVAPVTSTQPQNSSTTSSEVPTTSELPITSSQPQNSSTTSSATSVQPVSTTSTSQDNITTSEQTTIEPVTSEKPQPSTSMKPAPTTTQQVNTTVPQVDCSNSNEGEKIPSPTKCTEFYVCSHGTAYRFKCPKMAAGGRLYFDPKLDVCNWPQNVDCKVTLDPSLQQMQI